MALPIFQRTIVDDSGNVLAGASVTVKNASTGLNATIYSDRSSTALSNPFTADSNGLATFYASAGEYTVTATDGTNSITWNYVVMTGTAAQVDTGTGDNQITLNSTVGHTTDATRITDWEDLVFSDLIIGQKLYYDAASLNVPSLITDISTSGTLQVFKTNSASFGGFILDSRSGLSATVNVASGSVSSVSESWTTTNTTVDGSGFIKEASPIVKLYDDSIEVEGLSKFGGAPEMTKVSTGVYEITGTQGLRLDGGWYIETPNDRNGNKYFNIEWSQSIEPENERGVVSELVDDVVVTIETFERVWKSETGLFENGDPVDISEYQSRAVSLRFNEVKQEEVEDV